MQVQQVFDISATWINAMSVTQVALDLLNRGSGLAGYRGGCVLSGSFDHVMLVLWLSSGLSGVGWLIEKERLWEIGPLSLSY